MRGHTDIMFRKWLGIGITVALLATACAPASADSAQTASAHPLTVVATTTIVGDVVKAVGGDAIALSVLLPVGADPHGFEPTPQDVATVADADAVFANGVGLEEFLKPLIENAGGDAEIVSVSEHVPVLAFGGARADAQEAALSGADPHVWLDPALVAMWTHTIEDTLSRLDAAHAEIYAANARAYRAELDDLDAWIRAQVAQVPEANRKLVTDHTAFGYFAARYGFEQVGAVIPGYSTLAQPSAQELAALEDAIRALGVKAIFVGNTVNPDLSQRVADDTGTQLVFLYSGSLSGADGPAGTYVDFMQYNVSAIVNALK